MIAGRRCVVDRAMRIGAVMAAVAMTIRTGTVAAGTMTIAGRRCAADKAMTIGAVQAAVAMTMTAVAAGTAIRKVTRARRSAAGMIVVVPEAGATTTIEAAAPAATSPAVAAATTIAAMVAVGMAIPKVTRRPRNAAGTTVVTTTTAADAQVTIVPMIAAGAPAARATAVGSATREVIHRPPNAVGKAVEMTTNAGAPATPVPIIKVVLVAAKAKGRAAGSAIRADIPRRHRKVGTPVVAAIARALAVKR